MEKYERLTKEELTDFVSRAVVQLPPTLTQQLMSVVLELEEYRDKIEDGTLIELPKKCYQVIWVLGWEIIEYDVVSITYDYDKATITKVIAVCPNSRQVFTDRDLGHFDGIGTHVFFNKAKAAAENKLKELQNETK